MRSVDLHKFFEHATGEGVCVGVGAGREPEETLGGGKTEDHNGKKRRSVL